MAINYTYYFPWIEVDQSTNIMQKLSYQVIGVDDGTGQASVVQGEIDASVDPTPRDYSILTKTTLDWWFDTFGDPVSKKAEVDSKIANVLSPPPAATVKLPPVSA